jgi:hypothetical protein
MRRSFALALALTACASAPPEAQPSGNELALREARPHRWGVVCRDLRAGYGEAPFLRFDFLDPHRIADLHFLFGPGPRYDEHAVPGDLYGPFHGERVGDESSTYLGADDYKITDRFHLYLPPFLPGFEDARVGRDRDSARQNAAAEVSVNGQRYARILHLRCIRSE